MADHSPLFLRFVDSVRTAIKECDIHAVKKKLDQGEAFFLVDVREESERAKGYLPGSMYLGKGVIERDIEKAIPDLNAEIVLYCGGGFRSAIAAECLNRMGYKNVTSMDGGYRGWSEAKYPIVKA